MEQSFTKEELGIIINSLTLRESAMLRDAEAYRDQKNVDAQKDCLNEFHKAHKLRDKIREMYFSK